MTLSADKGPIIRPRPGDLETATHPHPFRPSGEYVGAHREICDLCGMAGERMHRALAG